MCQYNNMHIASPSEKWKDKYEFSFFFILYLKNLKRGEMKLYPLEFVTIL